MTDSVISLSGVGLTIDGKRILEHIDWEIRPGENWVVVGPNGAGKTSLLRILNGYQWPTSGKIRVLGESFGKVDLRELRKKIGLVSSYVSDWIQENQNVLDIVMSGRYASIGLWSRPGASDKIFAKALLVRVGCGRFSDSRFGKLSQGEKQKVVIARALMAKPRLLVLDEPCSGLDIPAREKLLKALSSMAARKSPSLVYVTHRIEEIPQGFAHAILMKGGRIIRKGEIGEVLDDEGLTRCFGVAIGVRRWGQRFYAVVDG